MSEAFVESDPERMALDALVSVTGRALRRFHQRTVAAHGLTSTSIGVLGVVADSIAVSHRELSGRLGVTPATLTPVVDALEAAGEVSRERDRADRRVVRLSITPRGQDRLLVAAADVAATYGARLPHPPPEHAAIIRAYLLAVLAAVGDEERER